MKKLYAEWHKLEYRPSKDFRTTPESLERVAQHLGQSYSEFEDKSLSASAQYYTTETLHRLIDFEFVNSPKHGKTLNRVVIQGEAFAALKLDTGRILTVMEQEGFTATEAHSRILLPHLLLSWDTLDQHFKADAYTSTCKIISPLVDPSNNYAKTWQAGKRPKGRSANTQGKRLTFYQADKIHPDLAPGTTTMELQLFGDTAHKYIYSTLTRDVDLTLRMLGVIRSYIEFKSLAGDSNKSRRPIADFWRDLIGNIPAIHLPMLNKPVPQLNNQIAKFRELLFGRKQKLGVDTFVKALVDFAVEQGFTGKLAAELVEF